jgi:putative endonuclease
MKFYVYILYSATLQQYYTGFSQYSGKRLRQHKREHKSWSARANDWEEVYSCSVSSRIEARNLEKKIKARGAKRFLADLNDEK